MRCEITLEPCPLRRGPLPMPYPVKGASAFRWRSSVIQNPAIVKIYFHALAMIVLTADISRTHCASFWK